METLEKWLAADRAGFKRYWKGGTVIVTSGRSPLSFCTIRFCSHGQYHTITKYGETFESAADRAVEAWETQYGIRNMRA